jgi:hypothetical protein
VRRFSVPLLLVVCALSAGCGGGGLKMPETRGISERAALKALGSRGLCDVLPKDADWSAAERARVDTVVDQDPLPGAPVEPTTHITIWVRTRNRGDAFEHGAPGCGSSSRIELHVDSSG